MKVPPKVILLVDDDRESHSLFKHILKLVPGKYDVHTANNGQAALDYLSAKSNPLPDYVFMDMNMPRMSGLECLADIRSHSRLRSLPVIVWTMGSRTHDLSDARETGASAFFIKPADFDDFYEALLFILSASHSPGRYATHGIEFFTEV